MQRNSKKAGNNGTQNIKVFVRCRPMNSQEKNSRSFGVVDCHSSREITVRERPHEKFSKTFSFDRVFGPDSKQVDVYKTVAKNCVDEVLSGFNCTIFAYGQTGTGKTFTMEGARSPDSVSWEDDPLAGIVPRCVNHLFDELRIQKVEFTIRVSFIELYNEELFDLLSPHDDLSKLRLYEDIAKKGSCIIHGLEEVLVRSKADVYKVMEKGSSKRQTAATLMNALSSRSHTVFTVTVHIKENTIDGDELLKTGKLNLVDLAGSENIGRSGAVEKRAREAGNINMSLLTLGRVITALVEKAPHVPYRESKLTRLLQDALGGRTKTSIIATVSPASVNLEETLSTLDYAHRAKNIQNKPEINQKLNTKEFIGDLSDEIERLRRDLMSAREKNGVYLAPENYQEMLATKEMQANEIAEKINHIRALEKEIEKRIEMFNEISRKLEDTTEKLGETENVLTDTRKTLSCTQKLLHITAQERDEQKFIVSAHVKTEDKLQSEGKTLVKLADETTSDLSKLHDKLDRKKRVETKNLEVTSEFEDSYVACLEAMRKDMLNAVTKQNNEVDNISADLDTCVKQSKKEIKIMASHLTELHKDQSSLISEIHSLFKQKVQSHVQSTESVSSRVIEDCNRQVEALQSFQKDELVVAFDKMASLITSQAGYITKLQTSINEKVNALAAECELHHEKQQKISAQFAEEVDSLFDAYKTHFASCHESISNVKKSVDSNSQNVANRITAMMNQLNELQRENAEFTALAGKDLNDATSHVSDLQKQTSVLDKSAKGLTKSLDDMSLKTVSAVNSLKTDTLTYAENVLNELEADVQHLGEERCALESAVSRYTNDTRQNIANTMSAVQTHVEQINDVCKEDIEMLHKKSDEAVTTFTEKIDSHKNSLEAEGQRLEAESDRLCGNLVHSHLDLQKWSSAHDEQLGACQMQIADLFSHRFARDVPTGETPLRKDYTFSRFLTATSPHDRLLERYRCMTPDSKVINIPLPNFDEEKDDAFRRPSSPESLVTSVSDSSHLEDEVIASKSHSRSASDLRSQSGSTVSVKSDKGFIVPVVPLSREGSGIPLSRSSSTSSIPDTKENKENSSSTKKRELKQPSVYLSSGLDKSAHPESHHPRSRRILGMQN